MKEKVDNGRWTLPGGWADVGYTPFEVAAKEAEEETGLVVGPVRLLALFDKRKHAHPPQPWYVYKAFIRCEVRGGSPDSGYGRDRGCTLVQAGRIARHRTVGRSDDAIAVGYAV